MYCLSFKNRKKDLVKKKKNGQFTEYFYHFSCNRLYLKTDQHTQSFMCLDFTNFNKYSVFLSDKQDLEFKYDYMSILYEYY